MRRALALILALSGCAAAVAPLLPSYRDQSVTIASKADFDPARFAGLWHEVARFPVPFQSNCPRATAEYTAPDAEGAIRLRNTCRDADGAALRAITGRAEVTGPGRLRVSLSGVPFDAPLWVLWADTDYRTVVLGQPDGRAGWILNRQPTIPADRMAAAKTVLDFNGYDPARLVFPPVGENPAN